jgi:hypothetical protein
VGTVTRIVCLANSSKLSGRCVAGKTVIGRGVGAWVRPVSAREHEEVSEHERQYQDGTDPQVLDLIDVPLLAPHPRDYQRENWRLNPKYYWVRVDRLRWKDLAALCDPAGTLWINGHRTFNGRNDKIPEAEAQALTSSLRLLKVDQVRLRVFAPSSAFGNNKRRVQAQFAHAGDAYALWVTDPRYEVHFLSQPDGIYELGECYLTVSLGEAYKDDCFKLVAAIIEGPGGVIP